MIISEALLERAAFEFLSSSSPSRYVRRAQYLGGLARLKEKVDSGEITPAMARNWVLDRWRFVLTAQQRGREEIELALVLPTLGQRSDEWVQALLRAMSVSDAPGAAWISALARSIRKRRSENTMIERPTSEVASTTASAMAVLTESAWSDAVKPEVTVLTRHAA